ncbi:MAG TPA: SRPBCC domain-containing protein [Fimbriimonadaceae bacterium]|jgi:uncharacterized protein YndB with AHSA1/START domain
MATQQTYIPGPAAGAHVEKDGENWTLVLVRELKHSPEKVWRALTDPKELREWAPFDADGNLGTTGAKGMLSTVGAPKEHITETVVTQAEEPRLLVYSWNGNDTRWELEPNNEGTKLTLWAKIDRRYIAMGAAGWHICLDVMDRLLANNPIGRMVGMETMKFEGWQRLNKEYANLFKVEMPSWQGGKKNE